MNQTTRTVLRIGIAISLLIYLTLSGAINWSALLSLATAWPVTLVASFLFLIDLVITAWRLCILLKPRRLHLSLIGSVRLSLIGLFFNACLPGSAGGDVMRIFYATRGNDGRRTEVATIMLLDRAVGMFALVRENFSYHSCLSQKRRNNADRIRCFAAGPGDVYRHYVAPIVLCK